MRWLLLAAFVRLLAGDPDVAHRLDAAVGAFVGTSGTQSPGLSVAIVQNGRLTYAHGFGDATPDDRFRIASNTKTFTAVAIMQLVEAHRVDLDAKVSIYVPEAPYASKITVRELLTHTCGLADYSDGLSDQDLQVPTTAAHILSLIGAHSLEFTPGTQYHYSNSEYVVLGLVVERVTGEKLHDYVREHILVPANMTETTFDLAPPGAPVAPGFATPSGRPVDPYDGSWSFGAADMVSTARDLAKYDIALMSGKLVSAQTFAQMQTEVAQTGQKGYEYGLGFEVIPVGTWTYVGHHGLARGYTSQNEMVPSVGLAIVVLSNAATFQTDRVEQDILRALYPDLR